MKYDNPKAKSTNKNNAESFTNNGEISGSIGLGISQFHVFPDAAMPGDLRAIVDAECENTEVHPASVVVETLLPFGAAIDNVYVNYGGKKHYCRTNAVFVGKTPKDNKAFFGSSITRYFKKVPDMVQALRGQMLSGETIINALPDISNSADAECNKRSSSSLNIKGNRLIFREREIRSTFASAKRPGSSVRQLVNGLFYSGKADCQVKTGIKSIAGAHIAIIARTRCSDFSLLRKDAKHSEDFCSFFLFFLVDRPMLVPFPTRKPARDISTLQETISSRIQDARMLSLVKLSRQAKEHWNTIYTELANNVDGVAGSVLSQLEAHTIRLALIYALFAGHKMIKSQDLKAAHALVQYSRESALIIFNDYQQGINCSEKILSALREATNHEMTLSEISKNVFKNNKGKKIRPLLNEMEKTNLVHIRQEPTTGASKNIVKLVSAK